MQNLWDKALEAKKEIPIHPLLRAHGLHEGLGTMAEQQGWGSRPDRPFRHQGGGGAGWWGSSGSWSRG